MTDDPTHSRRWLWLSIAALVLPPLALLLVHSWLGWEGERLWQQAQARLKAEGETLDFMALVPKPVPDEDNFFAVEPLKDIALLIDGDETKGEPGARRARIKKLEMAADKSKALQPSGSTVDHGVKWDAQHWADYYRASERPTMPTAIGNPGRDILAALAAGDDLYAELHSALARPHSVVTPVYSECEMPKRLVFIPVPNLNACQSLSRLLMVRAYAGVSCGEKDQALNDERVMLRFVEGMGKDATLINALVAITVARMAIDPCWLMLENRELTAQQLIVLDASLARLNIEHMIVNALRGESVFMINSTDWIADEPGNGSLVAMYGGKPSTLRQGARLALCIALWNLNPQAVSEGNKGAAINHFLNYQLLPLRGSSLIGLTKGCAQLDADHKTSKVGKSVFDGVAMLSLPAFGGVGERALQTQARLHQALLACALERYFLLHQRYPETLNELLPAFIDKVLLDPCDDKPMRYARTPAGRYKLWSLGFDGEDDGAKVIASPQDAPSHPKLSARDYPGDWVWSYERLVPLAQE